jgi:hypothetical protein
LPFITIFFAIIILPLQQLHHFLLLIMSSTVHCFCFLVYVLCLQAAPILVHAQQGTPPSKRPIVQKPDTVFTSKQIITADTVRTGAGDSTVIGTTPPGEYPFTPQQDRIFYEAMRTEITSSARFQFEARRFSAMWMMAQEMQKLSPREVALANMAVDQRVLEPTARERESYNYGIAQSFTIPGVYNPYKRYGGLPGIGGDGLSIPLSLIGSLLGLTEDVSPTIKYTVEQPAEVEIVIYSVQAIAITRILKAPQGAGGYSVTWDLRTDAGFRVPVGDYIAEVRIGLQGYVRKRIRVG